MGAIVSRSKILLEPDADLFQSPLTPNGQQVRSPSASAVQLEGETLGPNYGAADVAARPLVNGGIELQQIQVAASEDGHHEGDASVMVGSASMLVGELGSGLGTTRGPGLDSTARETGLAAPTYAGGFEARSLREPQGPSIGQPPASQQQARQQLDMHSSPQQPPPGPLLPQVSPLQTPPRHPQLAASATLTRSQQTPAPAEHIPHQQPLPEQSSPSMQVMRSLTAQMATAAAAMSQRMQFQTTSSQGQGDVGQGDAGSHGSRSFVLGSEGHGPLGTFPIRAEVPALPPHLRADASQSSSRAGMLAGLARAGQVLRRRVVDPMIQQVARSPVPNPPDMMPQSFAGQKGGDVHAAAGVFTLVAQAMQDWTARTSLIAPGPQANPTARDESSASSLSPELIMEEVKRQVQIAMAEKNFELQEIQNQNALLRRALQGSSSGKEDGCDQRVLEGGLHWKFGRGT